LPYHPAFGDESVIKVHDPPYLRATGLTEASGSEEKPTTIPAPELSTGRNVLSPTANASVVPTAPSQQDDALMDDVEVLPSQLVPQPASETQQFLIHLEFPDHERPLLTHQVYADMPVQLLYLEIANGILNCAAHEIRILIGNKCLLHLGTITDRCFPGLPDVPTVFLYPNCTARVVRFTTAIGIGDDSIPFPPLERLPGHESKSSRDQSTGAELDDEMATVSQRRVSTRVQKRLQDAAPTARVIPPRRPVADRWFYDPVGLAASDDSRNLLLL
jgi:hypothetical protein